MRSSTLVSLTQPKKQTNTRVWDWRLTSRLDNWNIGMNGEGLQDTCIDRRCVDVCRVVWLSISYCVWIDVGLLFFFLFLFSTPILFLAIHLQNTHTLNMFTICSYDRNTHSQKQTEIGYGIAGCSSVLHTK